MELGNGFTFIGNQHVLEYNGKESKVDMLFFHRGLRCLVAVDLKIGAFKPEYAGKMNYYLSLLDRLERGADENRSIGIILCAIIALNVVRYIVESRCMLIYSLNVHVIIFLCFLSPH